MPNKDIAEIKDGAVYILQAGTPVFVKTADICSMTGKSNQWIGQLVSQGTLVKHKTAHGQMFNVSETVKNYCKKLELRATDKDEYEQKIETARSISEAKLKAAKAAIADLEAKELQGLMHHSQDVEAMTEDLVFEIRGALTALPGRLAVDLVGCNNAAEASEIIRREVYRIMDGLAKYKYDSAKYEERLRERLNKETLADDDEE